MSQSERQSEWRALRAAATIAGTAVAALWAVQLFGSATGLDLGEFGIYPRRPSALLGILAAPLIHGDLKHLFSNSLPLFVLLTGLLLRYPTTAPRLLCAVVLGGGLLVWWFGRPSYHIGASGINYGVVSFLFFSGVIRREPPDIALALLVTFLYGGMVWGVLPIERGISWEAHLYSALVGVAGAFVWMRRDRPAPTDDDDDDFADEFSEEEDRAYWHDDWNDGEDRRHDGRT